MKQLCGTTSTCRLVELGVENFCFVCSHISGQRFRLHHLSDSRFSTWPTVQSGISQQLLDNLLSVRRMNPTDGYIMNPIDFGESLTFDPVPSSGKQFD